MRSKNQEIRTSVLGSPIPNFSGALTTEEDVARVFMWFENRNPSASPVKIGDDVTTSLRSHWQSLGKVLQTFKGVRRKVGRVIEKVKNLDHFTRVLEDPAKWVPIKKALFRKVVNIEQENITKPNIAKVRLVINVIFVVNNLRFSF